MAKGDKYINLHNYLKSQKAETITLNFEKIETLIGDKLSSSAYKDRSRWSNSLAHSIGFGWMETDYRVSKIHLDKRIIEFSKKTKNILD